MHTYIWNGSKRGAPTTTRLLIAIGKTVDDAIANITQSPMDEAEKGMLLSFLTNHPPAATLGPSTTRVCIIR
jgi:hypothetical protein